ncbi:MAG: ribulokinase [Oscillospiraceae bacterium]|nr:ribulokinase [Oscillospiraceae bacterium]
MKTVIGIDYGTRSARALLVDTASGEVLSHHTVVYPHGVMDGDLASADDYENALEELLEAVVPEKYRPTVAGICVDATSLTLVPVDADGKVLCRLPGLTEHPHAQIKLWKRHTAETQAAEALSLARRRNEPFLGRTGGTVSAEWMLPKLLEIRDETPEIYEKIDLAFDLCEFLTFRLTGEPVRSLPSLSFKCLWAADLGFPSEEYLNALRPGFAEEYRRLLRGKIFRPGECAGSLRPDLCSRFGFPAGVRVAAGLLDGHTSSAALGALQPGDAVLVAGTSNVLAVQTEKLHDIEGICGIAEDGLSPGLYAIDSGQSCTGDMLEWYLQNALPAEIKEEASRKGTSPHELLAERIREPWNCRVIAADWWNGSRNAPCDLSLTGTLTGLTLNTKPEEIYLALLQGIVCGTRAIIEQCAAHGVQVGRMVAAGGIASKNPLLMQQYADILGMPVSVGDFPEGPALGAAVYAAAAAGALPTLEAAYEKMGIRKFTVYEPDNAHRAEYEALYQKNHKLRCLLQQLK